MNDDKPSEGGAFPLTRAPLPVDDSWSFAIATPDAIATGRLDEILTIFKAHGFTLGACRLLELEWGRMGRMYTHCDVPPPSETEQKRGMLPEVVMTKLYGLSPAAVIIVTHADGETSGRLLRCKGATVPEEAVRGTVRRLGEHQIFNLMHCPDDAPSAANELPYLVGRSDAEALVTLTLDGGTRGAIADVERLAMTLPAWAGWEVLSFPLIANRLRSRVIQLLGPRVWRNERAIVLLERAHRALVQERAALKRLDLAAERMEVARATLPEINEALIEVAGEGAIRDGLERLAALYDVSDTSKVLPLPAFLPEEIYLSPLEATALDAYRRS